MAIRRPSIWSALLGVLLCASFPATAENQRLEQEFQAAVSEYNSGQLAEAATKLEKLLRDLPNSFEVHELLGLTYAEQSEDSKANEHLQKAVLLKPGSASARTNLAANLTRMGKFDAAEREFKRAVELDPKNFDANHNLGELYVRSGNVKEAARFLARAQRTKPSSYDNGYDLTLAYLLTGRLPEARREVQSLLKQRNAAELHSLLGEIEEKAGNFVAAASQFEIAAHADPSESNLFDWGSELLLHRTLDPAIEVFQHANERYPKSPRLAIGLGLALYSRGNYDDAVKSLLKAADLDPSDPRCYFFLSKAYDSSPGQAQDVIDRFRRFVELHPKDPHAHYYYAMSLWKGHRAQQADLDFQQIGSLLKSAVALDPKLAEAHLQLGNLYSDQGKYADAIPEYVSALASRPDLADAHYRLGQAYVHTGDKVRAQEQLAAYQQLRTEHLAELDKQRADIRQFVYSAKGPSAGKQ